MLSEEGIRLVAVPLHALFAYLRREIRLSVQELIRELTGPTAGDAIWLAALAPRLLQLPPLGWRRLDGRTEQDSARGSRRARHELSVLLVTR